MVGWVGRKTETHGGKRKARENSSARYVPVGLKGGRRAVAAVAIVITVVVVGDRSLRGKRRNEVPRRGGVRLH